MKVLLAVDGSEHSLEVARRALPLLADPSEVTVLTVLSEIPGDDAGGIEGPVFTPQEQEQIWSVEKETARAAVDHAAEVLPPGTAVSEIVEVGDPAGVIVDVAARITADVIVVGTHGRGFFKRVLHGSVSEHVIRHAPCPVMVVHVAEATGPAET